MKKQLDEYDEITKLYYEERTRGRRKDQWTEQIAHLMEKKQRMYMKDFVEKKGFNLR